jgi:hypothetical protein
VPLNFVTSSVRETNRCGTCAARRYDIEGIEETTLDLNDDFSAVTRTRTPRKPGKGFYVHERELEGAGIFRLIELPTMVLCIDPVKQFIEAQGFTNIAFLEYGETS